MAKGFIIYTYCCMGETFAVLMAYNVKYKNSSMVATFVSLPCTKLNKQTTTFNKALTSYYFYIVLGNVIMTEDFKKAVKIADQLETEINLLGVSYDYVSVCTIAQFTAMAIRKQIPMYIGNSNPKLKIYDDVVAIIKGRINGQNID